jgi:hypothetical protein
MERDSVLAHACAQSTSIIRKLDKAVEGGAFPADHRLLMAVSCQIRHPFAQHQMGAQSVRPLSDLKTTSPASSDGEGIQSSSIPSVQRERSTARHSGAGIFKMAWEMAFGGISVGDPGADLLVSVLGEPCQVQRLVDGCQRVGRSGGFDGESGCNSRRRAFAPALPFGMAFEMSWLPIGRLRLDVPLCPGAQADFASTDLIAAGPRTGWPGSRLHVAEPISGRRT